MSKEQENIIFIKKKMMCQDWNNKEQNSLFFSNNYQYQNLTFSISININNRSYWVEPYFQESTKESDVLQKPDLWPGR